MAERFRPKPERLCGDSLGMVVVLATFLGNWYMLERGDDKGGCNFHQSHGHYIRFEEL
jgi:hypothetical protein